MCNTADIHTLSGMPATIVASTQWASLEEFCREFHMDAVEGEYELRRLLHPLGIRPLQVGVRLWFNVTHLGAALLIDCGACNTANCYEVLEWLQAHTKKRTRDNIVQAFSQLKPLRRGSKGWRTRPRGKGSLTERHILRTATDSFLDAYREVLKQKEGGQPPTP